ncbi:MAG: cytochrome c oxidase accessory protein CcoG [Bacteroidota bacterium]
MSVRNDEFRDSIGTITDTGKRNWIFAKKPVGKLYNWRIVVSIVYLAVFFTLPWIKVYDEPLFLFNLLERKFILFGVIFWPQDFFLFALGFLTFVVFVVLFTVVFGRIFCGWICPQTIFMEMVFRKIEYWIEGDMEKQKRLSQQAWNGEKILKRGGKFIAFFTMSFIIANYFLAYIIGMDNVMLYVREGIFKHIGTFIPLTIFTGVFFFVYWWFREQACLIVCPYGRLQGVMLDPNSIVVAYDYVRGEPRGKVTKHEENKLGDCIDCFACVKVCPTGIDIRNGTQMECVNCTACIDACDDIMEKVHRPLGLIRYASENNIAKKEKVKFTPRIAAYTFVLLSLLVALGFLLSTRKDVQATIMRAQGMLYQEQPDNKISNLYNIKLINKTRKDIPLTLKIEDDEIPGEIKMVGKDLLVKKESVGDGVFFVIVDKKYLHHRKNKIEIEIYQGDKKITEVKTNFMGPNK